MLVIEMSQSITPQQMMTTSGIDTEAHFMSHEELICQNLLQIMEEKYDELDRKMKDAIILLLIENGMDMVE